MKALDLFAGPGGWSLACQRLGIEEHGIEIDDAARATRDAAGFTTIHDDVVSFRDTGGYAIGEYDLLIASPPCQTFSAAGKGKGREALDTVLDAVHRIGEADVADWPTYSELTAIFGDERTALVVEPLKYALQLKPRYLAFEQVPTVLPVWEAYAEVLQAHGWHTWTSNVQAEQYGVPQTRKRAILLADSEYEVAPPTPTHSKYHSRSPERLDEGVKPWVSMAEALGWEGKVGFARKSDGREEVIIDGEAYRARDLRDTDQPAQVVTEKARSWQLRSNTSENATVRDIEQPAPTLHYGERLNKQEWQYARGSGRAGESGDRDAGHPAPTVTGKGTMTKHEGPMRMVKQMGAGMVERHGDRPPREPDQPAFTITGADGGGSVRVRWEPTVDNREAFTEAGQERTYIADVADDKPWTRERPATTIAGRDLVPDPGANANRFNGATKSHTDSESTRVTVAEAGVLQSFPADFPWQGTKTKQFQQVGNAIPPLLAEAMLSTLLSSPDPVEDYQKEEPVSYVPDEGAAEVAATVFERPTARRGDPPRTGNGQYLIQVDPTRKAVGYQRVTNAVKPLDDTFHLERWKVRTAARGFVKDAHLRDRLSAHMDDTQDSNREANAICDDAHVAGGGNIGRDWGTMMHALAQQADAGEMPQHLSDKASADLMAYLTWRMENGVKVIASELVVVHDDVKIAGTFDRIYEIDGVRYIGDLKTGSHRDLGLPSYAAQMSWYARGSLYDYPDGCTCSKFDKPDKPCAVLHSRTPLTGINTDKALIVWMPMGRAHCEHIWVDLTLGWEGAQLALQALDWRKRAKAEVEIK